MLSVISEVLVSLYLNLRLRILPFQERFDWLGHLAPLNESSNGFVTLRTSTHLF
ncbi:MAG: hypothetical protein RL518_130 [Pseudomonadota bacterium]